MSGFLPPISSCTRAPAFDGGGGDRRTDVLRAGEAHRVDVRRRRRARAPSREPGPITRLSTPGGRPARWTMSTSVHGDAGTSSAGLKTTQLPNASAGAIFHAGNRQREVPRRDRGDDAERLARDLDVDAGPDRVDLLAAEPHGFAGEELEDRAGARRLRRCRRRAACPARATAGGRARPCARGSRCRRDRGCRSAPAASSATTSRTRVAPTRSRARRRPSTPRANSPTTSPRFEGLMSADRSADSTASPSMRLGKVVDMSFITSGLQPRLRDLREVAEHVDHRREILAAVARGCARR